MATASGAPRVALAAPSGRPPEAVMPCAVPMSVEAALRAHWPEYVIEGAGLEAYRRAPGRPPVRCAKVQHDATQRCIFRCGYAAASAR